MKAPLLFAIVFMIHVMGISGFVLMQGCATRQPLDGTRSTTPPRPATAATAMRPVAPVMPPKPGVAAVEAPRPAIKEYVPPKPRVLTPPPAPVVSTPSTSSEAVFVSVEKGDSLSKIAKRYGVSTKELAAFNGLNDPNKIKIGQKIYLPGNAKMTSSTTRPKPAATSSSTTSSTSVKQRVGEGDYVVRAGDSLSRIAVQHGTTVKDLKQANKLTSDRILVGQVLAIPGAARSSTASKPVVTPPAPKVQTVTRTTSAPRMETISITPVTPQRAVVKEPVKPVAPTVVTPVKPTPAVESASIDEHFKYIVQEGETLRDISNAFIVSSEEILKINNLSSEQAIRPGMELRIPPSEF